MYAKPIEYFDVIIYSELCSELVDIFNLYLFIEITLKFFAVFREYIYTYVSYICISIYISIVHICFSFRGLCTLGKATPKKSDKSNM